ncbi:hypothetical protein L838_5006 [Mycobacterium avium MAV_120709_2344]|uniref:WXG100-like domain-containing protein n=3 Tax=Mycobacterium avium TaxID=1764 RepID=UPI00045169C8|nr:hypothetical protein [Mycobacterium avium]ETZ42099.1 hypothetical protein L838_5006 [Mycobacterium avium MAV_120709_2344]
MAPLAVDPEAMYAAGSAVAAIGDSLAANLTILTAGVSAHTGVDRAGEVFGLGYQDSAESMLKAAAGVVNACRKCGALIQQGASNYSAAEAASTLGGGSGALPAPSAPADLAAPGPPGTWGKGEPPPLLWAVIQALVSEVWPDGDVAGLHAAASRWHGFAAAMHGVQGTLNASKALFDSQHIPEGEKIDHALAEIGAAAAAIGQQCDALARTVDEFADRVGHAQQAIRDLLHRIEALGDIGHDIMLIIDGDAWDEIQKIARDVNAVLQHLGQEARAFEQEIRLLMQAADREIVTCQKYARRGLITFLGEDVGNPVATALDFGINVQEGVVKGAVGMGLGLVDLSPHWIALDPEGAGATWGGLVKNAWKESFVNAAVNPQEFAQARLQELKGLVHADDWTRDRPGLGAGEVAFDAATLIAPGLGEAGAAADGASAAARGAEAEADAAGAAGRVGGIAGARARWRTSPSQPPICRRTSRVSPRTCPRSSLRRVALRWFWGPAASRSRRRSNRRRVRRTARRVRSGARRPWQRPRLLPARQAIRALARTVRVRRPLQLRRRVAPSALTIGRPRQPPRLRRAVLVAWVVSMIRRPRQRRPLLLPAARAIRCRCRPALRTSPHRFRRRSRVSRYPCLPAACTTRSLSRRVVRMSQHRFRPPGRVSRLCRLLRATACRRLLLSCSTTRRHRCPCRPVDRPVRLRLSARIHRRRLHQRLRTSSPRGDPQKCQRPTAARTVLARVALRAGTRRASHRTAASQVVMGTAMAVHRTVRILMVITCRGTAMMDHPAASRRIQCIRRIRLATGGIGCQMSHLTRITANHWTSIGISPTTRSILTRLIATSAI